MKQHSNNLIIHFLICLCFIIIPIELMAQNKDMAHKTTLIVASKANPEDLTSFRIYVEKVMPMLLSLEGKIIKRSKVKDVFHGKSIGDFLLIMDFPSKYKLIDLFNSHEYQSIVPYRNKGFSKINILFADDLK